MKTTTNQKTGKPFPGPVLAMTGIYVLASIFLLIILAWDDNKKAQPVNPGVNRPTQTFDLKCTRDSGKSVIHIDGVKSTRRLLYIIKRSDNGADYKVIGAGIIPPGNDSNGNNVQFFDVSCTSDANATYNVTIISEDRSFHTSDTLSSGYSLAEDLNGN